MDNERIDSASDERTVNNVARHEYRILSDEEKAQMKKLKDMGRDFIEYCESLGEGRGLSIAKTKMQEAVFWSVFHVTE